MEDIKYLKEKNRIILWFDASNKGKLRWKKRVDNSQFGTIFATREVPFTKEVYLEWQIGYDSEVNHKKKKTELNDMIFVGANNKKKNPYELSEILYWMKQINLVSDKEIKNLINEIESRNYFLDEEYLISTTELKRVAISDFNFNQHDIMLPTFSKYNSPNGLSIEISIQKQQYAGGVQPMVYFIIPINCFSDNEIIGKKSQRGDELKFIIDNGNKKFFIDLFRIFGICSRAHKSDVLSILKLFN